MAAKGAINFGILAIRGKYLTNPGNAGPQYLIKKKFNRATTQGGWSWQLRRIRIRNVRDASIKRRSGLDVGLLLGWSQRDVRIIGSKRGINCLNTNRLRSDAARNNHKGQERGGLTQCADPLNLKT